MSGRAAGLYEAGRSPPSRGLEYVLSTCGANFKNPRLGGRREYLKRSNGKTFAQFGYSYDG